MSPFVWDLYIFVSTVVFSSAIRFYSQVKLHDTTTWTRKKSLAVADPGFPWGGGANPQRGAPTYYLANFSRKLHENEEILGRGGARPSRPPLDPPLTCIILGCFPQ